MRRVFRAFLALFGVPAIVLEGTPHPFYVAMVVLELALPPLTVVVATRVAEPD